MLLDDDNTVIETTEKEVRLQILKLVNSFQKDRVGYDMFGQKLEPGDWVLAVSVDDHKLFKRIGYVIRNTAKKTTIMTVSGWTRLTTTSLYSSRLLKIDKKDIDNIATNVRTQTKEK